MPVDALRAAAEPVIGTRADDPKKLEQPWQEEAWAFYDESGPLRYAATWISNLISRARLQAAKVTPGGEPEPITSGPAADAVEALAGGIDGQSAMLKEFGVQLTVPGIGYLVGTQITEGDSWKTYSSDELRLKSPATPGKMPVYEANYGPTGWQPLPPETLVIKVWRPHPRVHWQADSPARAALSSLRELRRISQYVDAVLASRVASAGILIIPQEASFPTASAKKDNPEQGQGVHPFVTEVMQVMMQAIKTPGTAAAIVPIPVEVPGEFADKFKHLDLATQLNDRVLEMRESALRQAAIALDVPAEILTGMSDMSHWAAWQIEEAAVKVHAEPLLEVVTGALTAGYLHPVLQTMNESTDGIILWADSANLATRPDRSGNAIQLYDRLELNGDALRREAGMSDFDKPSGKELEDMVFKALLKQPQIAAQASEGLGVDLPAATTPPPTAPGGGGGGGGPASSSGSDSRPAGSDSAGPPLTKNEPASPPAGTPPARSADLTHLLVFEGVIHRALERAGNRIRGAARNATELVDCPPEQAHCCVGGVVDAKDLLKGAWDRVPELAEALGYDPVALVSCLDEYAMTLLEHGFAYDRDSFAMAFNFRTVAA